MSAEYRLKTPLQIRFRDTDAMGHVNNAVFLSYLEYGRMKYWEAITGNRDYKKVDFILARAEIDYRSPLKLGEDVDIEVRCSQLRRSSFHLQYRIVTAAGRLIAEASTVQACYDYQKEKVKRLEEDLRSKIAAYDKIPATADA